MKKKRNIFLVILLLILISIVGNIGYLFYMSSADSYPEDDFLKKEANKKAIIIVAHDDDAISLSGTIAYLSENGWDVKEMCFYQGWNDKDSIRKLDLQCAAKILGMKSVEYYDIEFRKGLKELEKPWLPIPYSEFDSAYNKTIAMEHIERFISQNNPSVIFTLDNIMGGYGHPDHRYMSQLVLDYCKQHQTDSLFGVQRIYQAVFDPKMNEKILKKLEAFQLSKKLYHLNSSPKPNLYISLAGREDLKKKAMLNYRTEQNSLTKIWPYYNYYPASVYFKIFDKEYFRMLEKNNGFKEE